MAHRTITPYDRGTRLEPRIWVKNGTTGTEMPRPALDDDYGRVDFDNDEGATDLTLYVDPNNNPGGDNETTPQHLVIASLCERPLRVTADCQILTEDTDVLDKIAALLGSPEDWDGAADFLEDIANLIGTVRPHPGDNPAGDYAEAFEAETGRKMPDMSA